jgi:hypothetical protein
MIFFLDCLNNISVQIKRKNYQRRAQSPVSGQKKKIFTCLLKIIPAASRVILLKS